MPALNFKKEFARGVMAMLDKDYAIRNKVKPKTTTISSYRKRPFCKGDILYLFTGLRTKYCKRLGTVKCLRVEDFRIDCDSKFIEVLYLDGRLLSEQESVKLAQDDGFINHFEMIKRFKKIYGLPFFGQRIHLSNTYDRKYYLHKRTKDLGIKLQLNKCEKTINITSEQVEVVRKSKHISELATKHQYGVQIINPLFK